MTDSCKAILIHAAMILAAQILAPQTLVKPLLADDDLEIRATWAEPLAVDLVEQIDAWTEELELDESQVQFVSSSREALRVAEGAAATHDALIGLIRQADPEADALVMACRTGNAASLPPFDALVKERKWPQVVSDNLRLVLGISLAINQLYDEALENLSQLDTESVADPASLLFYRGATQFRLRERDEAKQTLSKLLERADDIPTRYATIARLMEAEINSTEPDSLQDIAQIMDSIRVRLDHGRAGKRVRGEEEEVIEKLDKMIEKLEEQLQQMQAAMSSGAGGNNLQPSSPMQDSMPAGGTGPGNVDPKSLGTQTEWGNLPPKEREKALQELGEEFPPHYRSVIEEYFRQLAKEPG